MRTRHAAKMPSMPLLWRVFIGNAVVLALASTVLVLSPATVSFPAAGRELVVLAVGLAVMLALNYVLLRRAISPLGDWPTSCKRSIGWRPDGAPTCRANRAR
jgi:hypothetical protein